MVDVCVLRMLEKYFCSIWSEIFDEISSAADYLTLGGANDVNPEVLWSELK